jgi:hypothetical protein
VQDTPLPPSCEPDPHAEEKALRQAKLQQLTLDAQRLVGESRRALAAHQVACERMMKAVQEARARLVVARGDSQRAAQQDAPPVTMASLSPAGSVQRRAAGLGLKDASQ